MDRVYKQIGRTILAFSLGLFVFYGADPACATTADPFAVRGVKVDVTADNAVTAREQAFAKAQAQAFQTLATRLLSGDEQSALQPPEGELLAAMVNDFEITEEHLSAVRYVGTYTFRFKQDAVRDYLAGYGMSYTDVTSKPVLILPFYEWDRQTLLWEQENPWRAAWSQSKDVQGLVPTVVPIGDLEDVSAIDAQTMAGYDQQALSAMLDRYKAGQALSALAKPVYRAGATDKGIEALESLNISLYQLQDGRMAFLKSFKIKPEAGDTVDGLFDKAIWQVRSALQQSWKEQTKVTAAQTNSLLVRVRFTSMHEWVETQKLLRRVQGVQDVQLRSLKLGEAFIDLKFQGAENRLRLALAQADMTLTTPQVSFTGGTAPLVYDLYLNKYR